MMCNKKVTANDQPTKSIVKGHTERSQKGKYFNEKILRELKSDKCRF